MLTNGSWIFWLYGKCQKYGIHTLFGFKSCLWSSTDLYGHAKVTYKTTLKGTLFRLTPRVSISFLIKINGSNKNLETYLLCQKV